MRNSSLPHDQRNNYSFGYWLNGWRKNPDNNSPDVLCFETGRYGMKVNVADLTKVRLGMLNDNISYVAALNKGAKRLDGLSAADLNISIKVNGRTYRAVSCKAGTDKQVGHLQFAPL